VSSVYGAPGMETIGPHGRFSETALCTGSSREVEGESGRVVRLVRPGFQSGCAVFGAWHGVLGWLGCRACCASCRVHGAVHARVLSDARVCVCARERACRSRHARAAQSACRTGPWRGLWGLWAASVDLVS
jgi:hypothetical protein